MNLTELCVQHFSLTSTSGRIVWRSSEQLIGWPLTLLSSWAKTGGCRVFNIIVVFVIRLCKILALFTRCLHISLAQSDCGATFRVSYSIRIRWFFILFLSFSKGFLNFLVDGQRARWYVLCFFSTRKMAFFVEISLFLSLCVHIQVDSNTHTLTTVRQEMSSFPRCEFSVP